MQHLQPVESSEHHMQCLLNKSRLGTSDRPRERWGALVPVQEGDL